MGCSEKFTDNGIDEALPGPLPPGLKSLMSLEDEMSSADYAVYVDSLIDNQLIEFYQHPDMTIWGSATGGYYKNELVFIDATYNAELGYSIEQFYLKSGEIVYVKIKKRMADWSSYFEKYGDTEDADPRKMTYLDEKLEYEWYPEGFFVQTFNGKFADSLFNEVILKQGYDMIAFLNKHNDLE